MTRPPRDPVRAEHLGGRPRLAARYRQWLTDLINGDAAIECGAEWITTDRDHARFPDLRWRRPVS